MDLFINGQKAGARAYAPGDALVGFCAPGEAQDALGLFGLNAAAWHEVDTHVGTRYESFPGYDYINVNVPALHALEHPGSRVTILFEGGKTLFVSAHAPLLEPLRRQYEDAKGEAPAPGRAIHLFFNQIIAGQGEFLQQMEEKLEDLEERVLARQTDNVTAEISGYRRQILALKRYYEGLVDLHEDLEENQNGFFTKEEIQLFRLQTNRADRFFRAAQNLGEYVTQVREAYQNQLDISMNETMQLFTVITAIFLPLTLVAGWYGMNLAMPEYLFPYSYPIVIVVSAAIAVGLVWYFRKNKWI